MKPLRIAQIVPSLLPTGPVRVALDLAQSFREAGHFVSVYFFDDKPGAASVENSFRLSFFEKKDFSKYDVIHTHGLRPDAYRFFQISHPNTITTLHNYVKVDLGFAYGKIVAHLATPIWRKMVSKHQNRVVLSADMERYYNEANWPRPMCVIPNGRPLPDGPPDQTLAENITTFSCGRIVLGTISHNNPRKGLLQILKLLKEHPEYCFVHVGSGQELLEKEAKQHGVANQCLWIASRPDAAKQLPLFDILVLPSYAEGFPLVLLEALAANVPVVASAIPVFKENFPDSVVKTFQLDVLSSLSNAVQLVWKEKENRANAGHEWYLKHFTPKQIATRYEVIYRA